MIDCSAKTFISVGLRMTHNGFGLGEGGEFNHKKINRMTEFEHTTKVDLENGSPAFAKPVLQAGAVNLAGF